jgi:hypothetical protein
VTSSSTATTAATGGRISPRPAWIQAGLARKRTLLPHFLSVKMGQAGGAVGAIYIIPALRGNHPQNLKDLGATCTC